MTTYSPDEVRGMIRKAIKAAGSQKAYAAKLAISVGYLCDVLAGRRTIGPRFLNDLSLETVPPPVLEPRYRRIDP